MVDRLLSSLTFEQMQIFSKLNMEFYWISKENLIDIIKRNPDATHYDIRIALQTKNYKKIKIKKDKKWSFK